MYGMKSLKCMQCKILYNDWNVRNAWIVCNVQNIYNVCSACNVCNVFIVYDM